MQDFNRLQFSVLEASQTLAGHATGTSKGLSTNNLLLLRRWLFWRITIGWSEAPHNMPGAEAADYECLVRGLALAAIKLSESVLKE